MFVEDFDAWAIDSNRVEGHGLIGVFYFNSFRDSVPHQVGCRRALFRTKAEAKRALPIAKQLYPKATVRRVHVVINVE